MNEELKQGFPTEGELTKALSGLEGENGTSIPCPSIAELRQFAMGKYGLDEPMLLGMLDHLADCESCAQEMAKIRLELEAEQKRSRRWFGWKLGYALLCVALVAASWFWATRARSSGVATVDLRSITRGDETSAPAPGTLHRNTASVRILLPVGSADGAYEVGVFQQAGSTAPIVTGTARTNLENNDLVLRLPLLLKSVRPGSYSLGIRHGNSEWAYYPVRID
jgi:hypothetical protein